MQTKTLTNEALAILDGYLHFRFGSAVCRVPYFNNKTARIRGALRALVGKGTPDEIRDETLSLVLKMHIDQNSLADEALKKILVDNDLGIECSGFAYHILDANQKSTTGKSLSKSISFTDCNGVFARIRCSMRPVENCSVRTFADNENSIVIAPQDILPGDFITMLAYEKTDTAQPDRDHILVVHAVEYANNKPSIIHYSHSIAYPEDGLYGSGVRQGIISLYEAAENSDSRNLTSYSWNENGKIGADNPLFLKAKRARTELRRLTKN